MLGILLGSNAVLKGRIAQVRTGEGKSTIIAMLAGCLAIRGYCVDVITSSEYLAKRDQEKFHRYFEEMGVTSSHICANLQTTEMFDGQVLFGTNYNFEFAILRDMLYAKGLRHTKMQDKLMPRPFDVVIVDEVDSLFIDMAMNSARLAVPSPLHTSWIYNIAFNFVKEKVEKGLKATGKELR